MAVSVNGIVNASISIQDRGFNYGDGLFETIAMFDHKLHFWQQHFQRLQQGCNKLGIPVPEEALLIKEIKTLVHEHFNDSRDGVVKLVITRGVGGRGYAALTEQPTHCISINPWPELNKDNENGITARLCRHRLMINPLLAGIKHLNRIDQVLARNEWQNNDIQEGLMLDLDQNVIEGTSSNLFVVKGQHLITAPVESCAVAGIIRSKVIQWAQQQKLQVSERKIHLSELNVMDEIFVCNSVWGIYPVTSLLDESDQSNNIFTKGQVTEYMQQQFQQSRENNALII